MTDANGFIRNRDRNEGVDSLATHADLTIHCQNSVARVIDGSDILGLCPTASGRISDQSGSGARDDVIVGTGNAGAHLPHFRILNQAANAYHTVWRQFAPFRQAGDFPLGRVLDLETTRNQDKRIEICFPSPVSALPGVAAALGIPIPSTMNRVLSFTDPIGTGAKWPRILVEPDPPERRLFTGAGAWPNGTRRGLTLIPSELAHALHFSLLTTAQRERVRTDYVGWMIGQVINGFQATHDIGVNTSPMVAFIESLDHFSLRFSEHVRRRDPAFPTAGVSDTTRDSFAWNQIRAATNPVDPQVARLRIREHEVPMLSAVPDPALTLHGSLDEGAIFGGLFVSLAYRVGLVTVMEAVLASKKLTFGEFFTWVKANRPGIGPEVDAIVQLWGL